MSTTQVITFVQGIYHHTKSKYIHEHSKLYSSLFWNTHRFFGIDDILAMAKLQHNNLEEEKLKLIGGFNPSEK